MYALSESIAFLLNRTGAAMGSAFVEELRARDLGLPMWRVLAALWSVGDQSLNQLSEMVSGDQSTLSRQVSALVGKGLVIRSRSGMDWRAVRLSLSTEGRALVEELVPSVERHERAALDGMTDADARRLRQLLNRIYANLITLDRAETAR